MPTTYNGIGTHYYGKSNLSKRPGPCPHCGSNVELSSYDTRLWFVVFFIPLIPLGRKRIIDKCNACTRHYVVDMQKWETARQLEVSGAQDEYRKSPSPESAIALHQRLLRFHQQQQAAELQKEMAERFADNAKVQAYLGAALEHVGRLDEAAAYYARALKLRPDLPEARIGVAEGEIRAGRLGEARNLLDFLQNPGASQLYSLQPLETLAVAYQKAGQHHEALDLFSRLLTELPKLAEVNAFRKLVAKSEKALGKGDSVLPKQKFSLMRWLREREANAGGPSLKRLGIVLGVILGLVALGFIINNEYSRRHRKIFVVNAFPLPATVEIRERGLKEKVRNTHDFVLPEGRYHVSVSGPVREELELDARTSYWSRWGNDPAWLINVGGASALAFETAVYSAHPSPPAVEFYFGRSLEFFKNVTHPFEDLSDSIKANAGETRTLTQLKIFRGDNAGLFEYLERHGRAPDAITFAEARLRAMPEDKELLHLYARRCAEQKQTERVDRYLKGGLTNRPVLIEWHRAYQRLHENSRELPELLAYYERLLKDAPTNSGLLYLRGRIEPNRVAARDYLQRAAGADPKSPYPLLALGYDRMVEADWSEAKRQLTRATELAPDDPTFNHYLFMVRLGLGEAAGLQKHLEEDLAKKPLDIRSELSLIKALVAQGQNDAAAKSAAAFQRRLLDHYGQEARGTASRVNWTALYSVGDFAGLEKAAGAERSSFARQALVEALLEQGRVTDALKTSVAGDSDQEQAFWSLAVAVASHHSGDTNAASTWRGKAIELMRGGDRDVALASVFLERATPPRHEEINDIVLSPSDKALLLCALYQLHPDTPELAAAARRFNVDFAFPHHLIQRVTENAKTQAAGP